MPVMHKVTSFDQAVPRAKKGETPSSTGKKRGRPVGSKNKNYNKVNQPVVNDRTGYKWECRNKHTSIQPIRLISMSCPECGGAMHCVSDNGVKRANEKIKYYDADGNVFYRDNKGNPYYE